MPTRDISSEVRLQRDYYTRIVDRYDDLHVHDADEHSTACKIIAAFLPLLGARTVLDVGAGTGRAASILSELDPTLRLYAIDPVSALVEKARTKLQGRVLVGDGAHLPFRDGAYDATVATGTLHHVSDPDAVVREMLRVSRRAVFISDGNVFGAGTRIVRLIKAGLYALSLWKAIKFVQTRGKGYSVTEGDGVAYSYSVFFSYRLLCENTAMTFTVPLHPNITGRMRASSRFSSSHNLVCAFKNGLAK
jgi:SAM-dependent methyltransferase